MSRKNNQIYPIDTEQEFRTSKENIKIPNGLKIDKIEASHQYFKNESQQIRTTPKQLQQNLKKFADEDKLSRLEKYQQKDSQDPLNKLFVAPENFQGPKTNRISTDRIWLLFLILIYVVIILYSIIAFFQGKIDRINNGIDFRGQVCGVGKLKIKPYLYYADPLIDPNVAWCVRQCPPSSGGSICIYDTDGITWTQFCYTQMQADTLARYCIPKEPQNRQIILNQLNQPTNALKRLIADLYISWDLLFLDSFFSIFICLIFSILSTYKVMISFITWVGIIGTSLSLGLFAYLFRIEANRIHQFLCIPGSDQTVCGGPREQFLNSMSYILASLSLIYTLYVACIFKRILNGIQLIKLEQIIFQALSQIRIIPFLLSLIGIIISSIMFIVMILSMTIGDAQIIEAQNINGNKLWKLFLNQNMINMNIYVIFILIFSLGLLVVINDLVTSYSIAMWYFTKQKETVTIPKKFVIQSILRYHLGSCVFITFNHIFLKLPKFIIGLTTSILIALPQQLNCVRYTQAFCMLCIHSFEIFLKYISLHSIVQMAIWSEPYYQSSKKAYFLLFRNKEKVKDLDNLQSFIIIQIRIFLSLMGSLPVYIIIVFVKITPIGTNTNQIEMPIIPFIFMFIMSYFISSLFQGSQDMTSKAVIQLYLMDCEMFFGEQRYTEQFIREFMDFIQNEKQEINFLEKFEKVFLLLKLPNITSLIIQELIDLDKSSSEESASESDNDDDEEDLGDIDDSQERNKLSTPIDDLKPIRDNENKKKFEEQLNGSYYKDQNRDQQQQLIVNPMVPDKHINNQSSLTIPDQNNVSKLDLSNQFLPVPNFSGAGDISQISINHIDEESNQRKKKKLKF